MTQAELRRPGYHGLPADECVRRYWGRLGRAKALLLLVLLAVLALLAWVVLSDAVAFGPTLLAEAGLLLAALTAHTAFQLYCARLLGELTNILIQDCDPPKYRAVMGELLRRDRFHRSQSTCKLECAAADYYDARPARALGLLGELAFKNPGHPRWARAYNLQALCCSALGDTAGRDAAVEALTRFRLRYKQGSPGRRMLDDLLADMALWFKPHEAWDEADGAHIAARLGAAPDRLSHLCWQLNAAEYALLHGQRAKARQLLAHAQAGPLPAVCAQKLAALEQAL